MYISIHACLHYVYICHGVLEEALASARSAYAAVALRLCGFVETTWLIEMDTDSI